MPHLLATNDFPPKLGGIQTYLYELWRRLPEGMATVYTTSYEGDASFDAGHDIRIVRSSSRLLLPTRTTIEQIERLADETGSSLVVLDPALPLGLLGPMLSREYGLVVHGAEITVPGRLPVLQERLAGVLSSAAWIVAAGGYPLSVARGVTGGRLPPVTEIPPGVDTDRFRPLNETERYRARRRFGIREDALVVASVSRLVPRKGMDVLLRAIARLQRTRPQLVLAVAGKGRDERRLRLLARAAGVEPRWLGRLSNEDLPLAYAMADVYAMCCRDRWFGLEQEGFGIVFLEAAACGVPQVAGRSGGSAEAVVDGVTGYVVERPTSPRDVADALEPLLDDPDLRTSFGEAGRERAVADFSYDKLSHRLERALIEAGG